MVQSKSLFRNGFLKFLRVAGTFYKRVFCHLQQTFEEAEKGFDETLAKEKGMNRDDRVHGALLILNELVRISSMEGEVNVQLHTTPFYCPVMHSMFSMHSLVRAGS